MSTSTRTPQFALVDTILQRVVGMILDSSCLLVLMNLQSARQFQTDKTVSESIGMPLSKVTSCLRTLKEQKLINGKPYFEMVGDRRKNTEAYFIDYRSVIEGIVFKYRKIVTDYNESRKVEQIMYKCSFDNLSYPYEEVVNYLDNDTHKLLCPECGRPLELVNTHDSEGNKKLGEVTFQMKMLKDDLEKLKDEYRSIHDYPIYAVPNLNPIIESPNSRKSQTGVRHRTYNGGVCRDARTKMSLGPMPWEGDDEMVEVNSMVEQTSVMESEENVDIFRGIDYLQNIFLRPNKTFNQKEFSIVLGSNHTSPVLPTVVRAKKMSQRRPVIRSVSATPQM